MKELKISTFVKFTEDGWNITHKGRIIEISLYSYFIDSPTYGRFWISKSNVQEVYKTYKFVKESTGRWYIEIPEWPGDRSELEMVSGADTMLEYMAEDGSFLEVTFSDEQFSGSNQLKFVRETEELGNGAYYKLKTYQGVKINLNVWLCDVTKFVFGYFPRKIFFQKCNIY